jgi:hypothetical protein
MIFMARKLKDEQKARNRRSSQYFTHLLCKVISGIEIPLSTVQLFRKKQAVGIFSYPISPGVFAERNFCHSACGFLLVHTCTLADRFKDMSRKGNCWDNAVAESFFKTLKTELIYHRKFVTRQEARLAVFEYIEGWYNRKRRHSALGYCTPCHLERLYLENNVAA